MPANARAHLLISSALVALAPLIAEAQPAAPAIEASAVAGGSIGSATNSVGEIGDFGYSVPLSLPAGRNDLTPNVALIYSSAGANGPAGVGWGLGGLPAIGRIRREDGIRYDGTDEVALFPLGPFGQHNPDLRILSTAGVNGMHHFNGDLARYQPSQQRCGDAPCYWILSDGSGRTFFFGGTASSNSHPDRTTFPATVWEVPAANTPSRGIDFWLLMRVEDQYGNYYVVEYDSEHLPHRIRYNLHDAPTAQFRQRRLELEWEPRPDPIRSPFPLLRRLRRGRVYREGFGSEALVGGPESKLIDDYGFNYQRSEASGRSLLESVDRIMGGEAIVLGRYQYSSATPPTEVSAAGGSGFADSSDFSSREQSGNEGRAPWDSLTCDFNGDGFRDVVRVYHGANGRIVESMSGSIGGLDPASTNKTTTPGVEYYHDEWRNLAADINADGFDDLIHAQISLDLIHFEVSFGTGAGLLPPVAWEHTVMHSLSDREQMRHVQVVPGDFDGDGRTDLAIISAGDFLFWTVLSEASPDYPNRSSTSYTGTFSVLYGLGSSWTDPELEPALQGLDVTPMLHHPALVHDADGDGRDDVTIHWSSAPRPSGSSVVRPANPQVAVDRFYGSASGIQTFERTLHPTGQLTVGGYSLYGANVVGFEPRALDVQGDGTVESLLLYSGMDERNGFGSHPALLLPAGTDVRVFGDGWSFEQQDSRENAFPEAVHPQLANGNPSPDRWVRELFWDQTAIHRANWAYHAGDFDGDGLGDVAMAYRGEKGEQVHAASGNRDGTLGSLVHVIAGTAPELDGFCGGQPTGDALEFQYWAFAWTSVAGDFNGDGIRDLAEVYFGDLGGHRVDFLYGKAGVGIDPNSRVSVLGTEPMLIGDGTMTEVFATDVNGDGLDDVLMTSNWTHDEARPNVGWGERRHAVVASRGDRPDLLTLASGPFGGAVEVTYHSWPWMRALFDGPTPGCADAEGDRTWASECGAQSTAPISVVRSLKSLDPHTADEVSTYLQYHNLRVRPGFPADRRSLGFETIVSQDGLNLRKVTRTHAQVEPIVGQLVSELVELGEVPVASPQTFRRATDFKWYYYRFSAQSVPDRVQLDYVSRVFYERGISTSSQLEIFEFDEYGFVTKRMSKIGTDLTENEYRYHHDEPNWNLGIFASSISKVALPSGDYAIADMTRSHYSSLSPTRLQRTERFLVPKADHILCSSGAFPPAIRDGEPEPCEVELQQTDAVWADIFAAAVYGPSGLPHEIWSPSSGTQVLTYDHDFGAQVESVTNALNHQVRIEYDVLGNATAYADPSGNKEILDRDAFGRALHYRPPGWNGVAAVSWIYASGANRVDTVRSLENGTTATTITYADGFGSPHVQWRDGFLLTSQGPGASIELRNELRHSQSGSRLRSSLPKFLSDSDTSWEERRFDARGAITQIADQNASGLSQAVLSYRPQAGWELEVELAGLPEGHVYYDDQGRPAYSLDPSGVRRDYYYSPVGFLNRVTLPNGDELHFRRDSWGRLIRKWQTLSRGVVEGEVSLVHDSANRLIRATTLRAVTEYEYDAIGRLERELSPPGNAIVEYRYDEPGHRFGTGRLTTAERLGVSTHGLHYDERGNVDLVEVTIDGLVQTEVTKFTYDLQNRLIHRILPDGSFEDFDVSADGFLAEVKRNDRSIVKYENFDALGRPHTRRVLWDDSIGDYRAVTTLEFDERRQFNRLTSEAYGPNGSEIVQDAEYQYDAAGRLNGVVDLRNIRTLQLPDGTWIDTDSTEINTLDDSSRVATAWLLGASPPYDQGAAYEYDEAGVIERAAGIEYAYAACGSNTCVEGLDTAGRQVWAAEYDAAGYRVRFVENPGLIQDTYTYAYDNLGRLTEVQRNGTTIRRIDHDAFGRPVRESQPGFLSPALTTYFSSGGFIRQERSVAPGDFVTTANVEGVVTFVDGLIPGQPDRTDVDGSPSRLRGHPAQIPPEGVWIGLGDHQGSTVVVLDDQGLAVGRYSYLPFGEFDQSRSTGFDVLLAKHAGRGFDPATGNEYGSRHFDPETLMWFAPATGWTGGPESPHGFNSYALGGHNSFGRAASCPSFACHGLRRTGGLGLREVVGLLQNGVQNLGHDAGEAVQDAASEFYPAWLANHSAFVVANSIHLASVPIGILGLPLLPEELASSPGRTDAAIYEIIEGIGEGNEYQALRGIAGFSGEASLWAGTVAMVAGPLKGRVAISPRGGASGRSSWIKLGETASDAVVKQVGDGCGGACGQMLLKDHFGVVVDQAQIAANFISPEQLAANLNEIRGSWRGGITWPAPAAEVISTLNRTGSWSALLFDNPTPRPLTGWFREGHWVKVAGEAADRPGHLVIFDPRGTTYSLDLETFIKHWIDQGAVFRR